MTTRAGLPMMAAAALICLPSPTFASETEAKPATAAASETKTVKVASAKAPEAPKAARPPVTKPAAKRAVPRRLKPTLIAKIDLTSQRMTVTQHGKTLYSWKISSGRAGHITPRGTFRPKWASKMWYSRTYNNAPMPYAVFFNGGIATHGTNALNALGRPASHGCIRLRTPNARRLYQLVHKHGYARTRFVVVGTTPLGNRNRAVAQKKPVRHTTGRRAATVRARVAPRRTTGHRQVSAGHVRSRTYVVGAPRQTYRPQTHRIVRPSRLVYPGDRY